MQFGPLDRIGSGLDQDLEVLLDARIALGREPGGQLRMHFSRGRELALDKTGRDVADLLVESLDTELRGRLGL